MLSSSKKRIKKSLDVEINRAARFGYYIGVLLLDVAETTPRGVHKHLPGITVSIQHFRSMIRDYDVVIKTKLRRYFVMLPNLDEGESANIVRDRILFTARMQDWGPVNVGIAIYPLNGKTSRGLLKAAECDLKASLESKTEEDIATELA